MNTTRRVAIAGLLSLAAPISGYAASPVKGKASKCAPSAPLAVYGARAVSELAPIHLAIEKLYGADAAVRQGNVSNLVGKDPIADVAANGETQQLLHSVSGKNMRILMTVAEGHYSLVARRAAGIASLADLKGKRVLTYKRTTADFFLFKMLQKGGLSPADVSMLEAPYGKAFSVVEKGDVDAIAVWEPDGEQTLRYWRESGEDVVIFSGEDVYFERYNLCTNAESLADPCKRAAIVSLTKAIVEATRQINNDPAVEAKAQAAVVKAAGGALTNADVTLGWAGTKFVASFDETLIDLLVEQDVWLASQQQRTPRSRKELARLIDRSVYDEARAP
jgi:NitT/TauT family transport system substrate-binding protein